MMHGRGKSDFAIVAVKPTNKAERSAAELVERRAGTKGNAGQLSTCRPQSRISVSQACGNYLPFGPEVGEAMGRGGGGCRTFIVPYELMEAAPCRKSMISAEAWPRLIRSRPW